MTPEFTPFPKMPRLSREVVITEKIDGTNASILIAELDPHNAVMESLGTVFIEGKVHFILAGSRTRWITPQADNHGFAKWVQGNIEELAALGSGHHFGEWWGGGIQRGYGLQKGEKRWSLFNVDRWCPHGAEPQQVGESWDEVARVMVPKFQTPAPKCCHTVPVLYRGPFCTIETQRCLNALQSYGSWAANGFVNPEGIIVYHVAGRVGFKKTIKDDDKAKGAA